MQDQGCSSDCKFGKECFVRTSPKETIVIRESFWGPKSTQFTQTMRRDKLRQLLTSSRSNADRNTFNFFVNSREVRETGYLMILGNMLMLMSTIRS